MTAEAESWTVLRLIDWTKEYFARAGVDEPRLAAEVLLAHVLDCPRVALYARFDRPVEAGYLAGYRRLVRRAGEHEPIAYLTGEKEFYSLPLKVTADVLIPRPETELLVDAAIAAARGRDGAVGMWDVCTGSGCVAVAAARYAEALSVLATDISPAALGVARSNVERHGLGARVRIERADLLDLPAGAEVPEQFDIITANPPYVSDAEMAELPEQVRREPEVAVRAGPTGLERIAPVAREAPARLAPGGTLAMEIGFNQAEKVYDLLNRCGAYEDIRFLTDRAGIDRTVVARVAGG